ESRAEEERQEVTRRLIADPCKKTLFCRVGRSETTAQRLASEAHAHHLQLLQPTRGPHSTSLRLVSLRPTLQNPIRLTLSAPGDEKVLILSRGSVGSLNTRPSVARLPNGPVCSRPSWRSKRGESGSPRPIRPARSPCIGALSWLRKAGLPSAVPCPSRSSASLPSPTIR